MLVAALLTFGKPADRVELRTTKAPPSATLLDEKNSKHYLHTKTKTGGKAIFVNGKPTGWVVPAEYQLEVRCRNSLGRVAGVISHTFKYGADWDTYANGFATEKGNRLVWLPFPPRALNDRGWVLTNLGQVGLNPGEQEPYSVRTGYLWDGNRVVRLGPAQRTRFIAGGAIEGYVVTDVDGQTLDEPFAIQRGFKPSQLRYRPFVWKDGVRKELPIRKKPPF